MENASSRRARHRLALAAVVALAGILLAAPPAPAQFIILPDRSRVTMVPQPPYPIRTSFAVTPVVIPPGNQYVRISGSVSAFVVDPTRGYPGTGFIKPFYANDRAKAANFFGSPNYNPNPVVTGPFQVWW